MKSKRAEYYFYKKLIKLLISKEKHKTIKTLYKLGLDRLDVMYSNYLITGEFFNLYKIKTIEEFGILYLLDEKLLEV